MTPELYFYENTDLVPLGERGADQTTEQIPMLDDTYSLEFEQLWKAWPTKPVGRSKKKPSYVAFQKAHKTLGFTQEDIDFIRVDIERRILKDEKWALGFVPMFSTYFNQRWWNEAYSLVNAKRQSNGAIATDEDNKRAWAIAEKAAGRVVPDNYQQYLEPH